MDELGVIDRAQARRQLAAAVHQSFIDELGVLRTDLQRFTEAKSGTVKPETIAERLASYQRIKAKVQMYADLLEMQQVGIVSELDDLTALARMVGHAGQRGRRGGRWRGRGTDLIRRVIILNLDAQSD